MPLKDKYLAPSELRNMRVEVYWNLHKHLFSVRALEGPNKGRVISHSHGITLTDAKFVVQPAGRERVRREGKKNVHAFVRGRVVGGEFEHRYTMARSPLWLKDRVTYNPYIYDTFVSAKTKEPIFNADSVEMDVMLNEYKRFPRILSFHIELDK